MEIISTYGEWFVIADIIMAVFFGIIAIIWFIFAVYNYAESDYGLGFALTVVSIIFTILTISWVCNLANDLVPTYRVRINDTVTVSELQDTYDIVKYDKKNDVWIVKEKENSNE